MEKINLSKMNEVKENIDKEYLKALENVDFNNIVTNLKLDNNILKKNVTKINDTIEELKNCKKCKGLYMCKNKFEGHIFFPENNNEKLRFVYTPCKYQKKFEVEKQKKEASRNILDTVRMKDIDITDKNRLPLIKWLKNFYDEYEPNKILKGLYLHGTFGSGKTFLISCLLNELKEKKGAKIAKVYLPDLYRGLRDNFDLLDKKVSFYQNIEILLIDDIGSESVTEWNRDEILSAILQYRMNKALTTFFTSNLNLKELENHLALTKVGDDFIKSSRIIERVKQLSTPLELQSENKRN